MSHTITLHRVLCCPPERVYRAFITPSAMAKWLPPHGFTGEVHEMDVQLGGRWRMSFINHATGHAHAFGGHYLELSPGQGLRYSATFDDPGLPGEMQTSVRLRAVVMGCELNVEQSGIPDVIPAEACHLGWQQSLSLLAQLVEASAA